MSLRVLLLVLLLAVPGRACINEYFPMEDAKFIGSGKGAETAFGDYPQVDWPARVKLLEGRLAEGGDYKIKNDLAAGLMRVGDYTRAVRLLEEAEREHPGEYILAANLGTAYELSGDLEKAYAWIEKGIQRNADAHEGTEWLHLKILRARQALASDPRWLSKNTVLGLDFGNGVEPQKPADWDPVMVRTALRYQLHERMWFVKPPDPLIADLLADYANVAWLDGAEALAYDLYERALDYGPAATSLVEQRKQRLESGAPEGSIAVKALLATAVAVAMLLLAARGRR